MFKNFWKKHPIWSVLILLLVMVVVAIVICVMWIRGRVTDSLPILEGSVACAGIGAEITIDRDEKGVPVVNAKSMTDAFFAQGFLHAQDRFFQMDLSRRFAAGELAALFGERAIEFDVNQRPLNSRRKAKAMVKALDEESKLRFESYTRGVNKGLNSLGDVPPEYIILQVETEPWLIEDSMLIAFFFFDALSYNEIYEKNLGPMSELLAPALYEFLTPDFTSFDQTLVEDGLVQSIPIPGPEVLNLRDGKKRESSDRDVVRTFDDMGIGSNNWAVSKEKSETGLAVLANDPHLRASMPGSWYRMQLKWGEHKVTGLSAPGAPGILIGENQHVAWGFTNGMADHEDLIVVEVVPELENTYRTAQGEQKFELEEQEIKFLGGSKTIVIKSTIWGPIVGKDWRGRPLALKSTSASSKQHNLKLLDMMVAKNLDEGIAAAASWYGPSQNVLVADSAGRIGWALSGYLPKRVGFDGKAPTSWAAGDRSWQGEVERPILKDPASGLLSTANNRLTNQAKSRELSRVWVPAWRARRIHELLVAKDKHSVASLAQIQLDTRDEQYDRIQKLVRTDIDVQFSDEVAKATRIVASWNGHADLDSTGLHILKIFTERLREAVLGPLIQPCAIADETFAYNWPLKDEPFFALLKNRPMHLLAPVHESWRSMINQVFRQVVSDIVQETRFDLDTAWGGVRIVHYEHPLGQAPIIGDLLNMPSRGLPGDANTPRAQGTRFGASMRLVVSPGHAAAGLFQMPGGQSGHFESEFYGDQHQDWVEGQGTPFAPGKSRFKLVLKPE